jgi:hypothetical protein
MTAIQVKTYKGEILSIQKDDIRKIDYKFDIRKLEEERRKQEEQRKLEEERRKQEEQRRLEEERRKQEEQRRLEEERRKQEEQRRLEEERQKQEEQRRLEEERQKQEEQRRLEEERQKQEEQRRLEEERQKQEEQRRLEEERRKLEEERRKQEEQRRLVENRRKQEELLKNKYPFIKDNKNYLDLSLDKFNIKQSVLSSSYYNVAPMEMFLPIILENPNASEPKSLPLTTTNRWNYNISQINFITGGSSNNFLWEVEIPIPGFTHTNISFSHLNYWEGIFFSYIDSKIYVPLFSDFNSFTPKFLLGYRIRTTSLDSWNVYLGWENYSIRYKYIWKINIFYKSLFTNQSLLMLNSKDYTYKDKDYGVGSGSSMSFQGNSPLLVMEYERMFQDIYFRLRLGISHLKGYSDIDYYYNLYDLLNTYDINIINQIDINFYENHINSQYNLKGYFYNLHLGKMFSSINEVYVEYTYKNSSASSSSIKDHKVMEISNSLYFFYFNGFSVSNAIKDANVLFFLSLFHQIGGIPQIGDIPIKKNFEDLSIIRIGIREWF